jgi:hypothetical protein
MPLTTSDVFIGRILDTGVLFYLTYRQLVDPFTRPSVGVIVQTP